MHIHSKASSRPITSYPVAARHADVWSLLAKAESRCRLGLTNEAVIIADEAVRAELALRLGRPGALLSADRKGSVRIVDEGRVGVPAKSLLRLSELRKKAEQITGDEDLSAFEAEEAISISEEIVTNIGEGEDNPIFDGEETGFLSPSRAIGRVKPHRFSNEDVGQSETEFVTRLLLAKSILSSKKKRIPHLIGSMITILSALTCLFFGLVGISGVVMTFTGRLPFSIFGLFLDLLFMLIAYLFLKLTIYVRGETK